MKEKAKKVLTKYMERAPIKPDMRDCMNYLAGYFENNIGVKDALDAVQELVKERIIEYE